jgi:hypothetical protein|tara:strand:- start:99 stop:374 length:276 start_codon:yes stop_codon:yes gene_type:complete
MKHQTLNVITGETTTVDDGIEYVAIAPTAEAIRQKRNSKLQSEVDPVAGNTLRWAALTSEQQTAWATYRTALLDVPQQAGFPDVTWPTKPE